MTIISTTIFLQINNISRVLLSSGVRLGVHDKAKGIFCKSKKE